jgi:hypothetical protein
MLNYLNKLLAVATIVTFVPLSHAQDSKSNDKELSKEEEEVEKQLTLPSILVPSAPSAIESNSIIQAQSISGIDSTTACCTWNGWPQCVNISTFRRLSNPCHPT